MNHKFGPKKIMYRGWKISTLNHEVLDNSMELGTFISESFFSRSQSTKVFDSLWNSFSKKTNFDSSSSFATNGHFKKDLKFSFSGRFSMTLTLFLLYYVIENKIGNRSKRSLLIGYYLISDEGSLFWIIGWGKCQKGKNWNFHSLLNKMNKS